MQSCLLLEQNDYGIILLFAPIDRYTTDYSFIIVTIDYRILARQQSIKQIALGQKYLCETLALAKLLDIVFPIKNHVGIAAIIEFVHFENPLIVFKARSTSISFQCIMILHEHTISLRPFLEKLRHILMLFTL